MAIIGYNGVESTWGEGKFNWTKFTSPADGSISSILFYVHQVSTTNFQVAIYTDNSGSPGTNLANSSTYQKIGGYTGWIEIILPDIILTNGQIYWLAVQQDNFGYCGFSYNVGDANQCKFKVSGTFPTWDNNPTGLESEAYKSLIYAEISPIHQKTINSDAKIKVLNNQQNINSDAFIISSIRKEILSNAHIKIFDIEENILADAKIILKLQQNISSDASIKAIIQKTITSTAKIVIQILKDITNKINTSLLNIIDITNKVNTVIQVLSDVTNFINTCKSTISDIANDFRTKKLNILNVLNDVRFMYSWQKAADGSLQSLGKGYIKIYIDGVEQTDVDVDSINISKDLNSAHSATFDLARAYDASKPTMEATIQIKYNNWVLFAGYIIQISPADDPEKIRITCQDEYWKQNKSNVYYQVGHRPQDNKELYYNTIQQALSIEHSWSLDIGNFIPQTIDNFATGKSDAISRLIQEAGNYGWFYDVDGTKKLWTAGNGTTINIKRQTLSSNIKLYDLISHTFSEDAENIINKYRVQMGEKVIRKFDFAGGSRTYTGYNYSSFQGFLIPAWDRSYERLASPEGYAYGFNYPDPANPEDYKDIFKKYSIPYLDSELSSWSDRFPPVIKVYTPGFIYGAPTETIKDGFTIDFENKMVTFTEPIFAYQLDSRREPISIRAPTLKLFLWKKNYYSYTSDPTENPEEDISNPLMFFTNKMGSYPDIIIKDLNLSNLSIQEGGKRTLPDGTEEFIPSWDDTEFAKDYANWQLSKTCDKKIRGNITLTLDAICFYGIDLTKRIYIDGITESIMNIISMTYDLNSFTVSLSLENSRYYNRTVSYQSHGE